MLLTKLKDPTLRLRYAEQAVAEGWSRATLELNIRTCATIRPETKPSACSIMIARWCKHASDHAASVGTKPWRYLLVPHDEIVESNRLSDFCASKEKSEDQKNCTDALFFH